MSQFYFTFETILTFKSTLPIERVGSCLLPDQAWPGSARGWVWHFLSVKRPAESTRAHGPIAMPAEWALPKLPQTKQEKVWSIMGMKS